MTSPQLGTHGFSGEFIPSKNRMHSQRSFSVGIFEWKPKANGKGVKPGPVKVRVKGPTHAEQAVLDKAREISQQLGAGVYEGPRTVIATGRA